MLFNGACYSAVCLGIHHNNYYLFWEMTKMREITTKIYQIQELSEEAQLRAWEAAPDFSDAWDYGYQDTLEKFADIIGIKVYRYEVGGCYAPNFEYTESSILLDAPSGDALRLARYLWNNFAAHIQKRKYYSTQGEYINGRYTYKCRYSKILLSMDNCPLTGFYADQDILSPLIDALHYKRFYTDINDLIDDCLNNFFDTWQKEIEHIRSFEYFLEMCEANEYEFYENGDFYV